MTVLALTVGFIAVFGIGIAVGAAIVTARYRSRSQQERAVRDARMRGRLDRRSDGSGLEPPEPWKD